MSQAKRKIEDEVDALFKLPLPEFIGERNALAARLKKEGRVNEAERVKALVKPPISAWAVNQLYWKHRDAFDHLLVTGERFRKAQISRGGGKLTDMREALDARRETLTHLSDLAATLLLEAGHNPTQDTLRRITTTLEAMSAYSSLPDAPPSGRLTHDVDPPGFESLGSMAPSTGKAESTREPAWVASAKKQSRDVPNLKRSTESTSATRQLEKTRQLEETRQTKIAAAKASLQNFKRLLSEARARAQSAEAAQKKADADAKEAAKQKQEAEEMLEKARTALLDATRRGRSVAVEAEKAAKLVKDAERDVENATKELEKLFST